MKQSTSQGLRLQRHTTERAVTISHSFSKQDWTKTCLEHDQSLQSDRTSPYKLFGELFPIPSYYTDEHPMFINKDRLTPGRQMGGLF